MASASLYELPEGNWSKHWTSLETPISYQSPRQITLLCRKGVFLLLDILSLPRLEIPIYLVFTHSLRKKKQIPTFLKDTTTKWNVNSLWQVWTWVALYIFYKDDHYTISTSVAIQLVSLTYYETNLNQIRKIVLHQSSK